MTVLGRAVPDSALHDLRILRKKKLKKRKQSENVVPARSFILRLTKTGLFVRCTLLKWALMAELVDAQVSGTCVRKDVEVRVFFRAPSSPSFSSKYLKNHAKTDTPKG